MQGRRTRRRRCDHHGYRIDSEEVLEMAIKAEPAIAKAEEILEYLGSLDEIKKQIIKKQ